MTCDLFGCWWSLLLLNVAPVIAGAMVGTADAGTIARLRAERISRPLPPVRAILWRHARDLGTPTSRNGLSHRLAARSQDVQLALAPWRSPRCAALHSA